MAVKGELFLFIENYSIYLSLAITALTAATMGVFYKRCIRNAVNSKIEKLPYSQQHLNALISSINDIIFEFNEDKICLNAWFNNVADRPVDPSMLIGKKVEDVLGPEKAQKFNSALDYVIANRKATSIQYLSDHGTGKWLLTKLTPVFDQDGVYTHRISAAIADISEQKNYADALEEKERLLLEAQTVAKIGNWLFDSTTRETYLSANLLGILGTEHIPDNIERFEYYMSLVHPDDREACHQFLFSAATSPQKEYEHRIITPAGKLKYIRIIIGDKLFYDEGGLKRIFGIIQDITESKLSEKAIKKGRAELIEAQTIAKIGNWSLDIVARKISYSEEIHHIFEVDPSLLVHMGIKRLLLTYVHKNDKFILQHLFKSASIIDNYTCVFRIVTPGGTIKYVSIIIGTLLRNENGVRKIIGTLQDVTDRKQVEIDYKRTENKYKLVLEAIKMAAISLDNKGYVIFCNQHLAGLLGYTQKEILGMHWFDNFIPDELKESINTMLSNNAIPLQYTNPVVCRNGEQRIISWQNTISYDENGLLKETTSIGEDITDQQKATRELISAKELAEKSSKFKSDFLSIMSHEIRTPMNAVIGTTNLLISDDPRPEQLEYLNILKFSGENLLSIINDILDYNKIEAGKLELNEIKFNIHTLTKKIKQTFAAKAYEKGLKLELNIDPIIPEHLTGDQMRLSQILNNLISNAIKFTLKGKISIDLHALRIDSKQINIKFTVSDTGVGIAPDNINIIFDPFVQEPVINNNNIGGTGLGLAITKRLVNLHKSDITVVSNPGEGTTFGFIIAFKLPETDIKSNVPGTDNAPMLNLHGMSVLIVDDNKMNLLIASRFLKKWQANVDEALNGQIAVDMVNQKPYDLIIMDLQMPVMDGFEATVAIKKTHPQIPIIALTADAMPETYTKALATGMSDYLTKPFVPAVFFEKVSRYYKEII
jgi:two-component system sensor histidine kinase/response regulator